MRSLLLCLLVFHPGSWASGISASELGAGLTSVANTLKTAEQAKDVKKESDKKQKDLDAELGKVQGQENQATGAASRQGLYSAPPSNAVAPNRGYPILDPYARPGYWQQRGHQFKFNMGMAAKRAQIQNQKAQKAMAAENAMTNKMLGAVGQLMNTAGSQMEKIGKERDKAATKDFLAHCQNSGDCEYDKEKKVWRYPVTDEEGNPVTDEEGNTTYKEAPGDWFSDEDIRGANGGAKLLEGAEECEGEGYKQTAYRVGEDCLSRQAAIDAINKLREKSEKLTGQISDKTAYIGTLDQRITDYEAKLQNATADEKESFFDKIFLLQDQRDKEQNERSGLQRKLNGIQKAIDGTGQDLATGAGPFNSDC